MTIKRYWTICKISSDLLDIWMTGRRWPTTCQYSVALSALLASTPFGHQCDDYDKISDHDDICDDYDKISDNDDICDDYAKYLVRMIFVTIVEIIMTIMKKLNLVPTVIFIGRRARSGPDFFYDYLDEKHN